MKQALKKSDTNKRLIFNDFLPCKFKLITTRMLNILNQSHEHRDISAPEFSIMIILAEHNDISTRDINKIAVMDKATITRALDRLVAKKMISRVKSSSDGRLKKVKLTAKGKNTFYEIEKDALSYETKFLKNISVTELNSLLKTFEKLEHNLAELE